MTHTHHRHRVPHYQDLMHYRIMDILLVSTPYDTFILEEAGELAERMLGEFRNLDLHYAPALTGVSSGAEALRLARQNLSVALEESQAELVVEELPEVRADAGQLVMLFQNLLSNAIKFRGEERPRVEIRVERNNGEHLFVVKDNGIGIDPDYFDRIFVIFQRLHTRDEYPGTGIGLAVCKRIVERHAGRIWVESDGPGQGSTFYFTLAPKGD